MLSIPRDLWVDIPGIGASKINAANTASSFKEAGYAEGGMGMLEKVVSDNFGITLNYYALVNYKAFKDSVDTVGGIDVNIQSTDPRGIYDPSFRPSEGGALQLSNGVNHLNGQKSLNLARARGDPFNGVRGAYGFPKSDFTRTEHQRQMMLALKDKSMNMGVLSNPTKVGGLMDAVGNNVSTDFEVNELLSLYHMAKKIDSKNIQSLSLNNAEGKNLLSNYTTSNGQSALAPAAGLTDYSVIQAYVQKVLNATPVTKEAAHIVVLNGGQIPGLAKLKGDQLAKKGPVITAVGDAPKQYATTTIIDNSGGKKAATKKLLSDMYKGSATASDADLSKQYTADFIVILGNNEKAPADQATDSTGSSGSSSEI
jgi:LCP family protein required for cell wall assembly